MSCSVKSVGEEMELMRRELEELRSGGVPRPVRMEVFEDSADVGERKAIQDEKYLERRRRNNLAAKKSRDARKVREDQIALRVACLEEENAVLRGQVAMLREEAGLLGFYMLRKTLCE